jgi:epsilon-lactone hydrolase
MGQSEIDAVRALLGSKPRPVDWTQRRQRIEEVGSVWPVAEDIKCERVDFRSIDPIPT